MRNFAFLFAAILCATSAAAQTARIDTFNLSEEVEICMSCHGEAGVPTEPDYPIIFGQEYFYIYTQLRDYGAGRRQHELMTDIASAYSRDQAKEIAAYFAEQRWPSIQGDIQEGDQSTAELGITGGQCSACHGKWQGDSRIPRMAGQQPAYTERTMLDFKHEVRMNAPDKISTMKQLDDETISALARYLSSLQVSGN